MSTIHFVGGEKGGVGKSVLSRLLSQYFIDQNLPFVGLDADQSHATLSRFYAEFTQPINLDYFESTDAIMEVAVEDDHHVVVDLPAQSERFLDRWIEENGVLDMCEELELPFVYWYIVDDGMDSAKLLENFIQKYGTRMRCIVIKNRGRGNSFEAVENIVNSAMELGSDRLVQATLPALHGETMHKIDALNFSFWGAENLKDSSIEHLSLMERQRTKVWLRKSYAVIDQVCNGL
ncbi:mobilization protein MobD [Neptuniibacter sp. CAU 1671]|uniref:mobilization protein MobD n=1 Tax=Neptuniibacter sp. CAU 1671 TaxID=3032593 RepID=UPI0023DAE472|nr:mobilization protein MobD [Neptuniibacter sp. CAU 1671]MDF2182561.1 mobilization protein MobD [Neptuniibacter sp. CAU 1671]